MLSQSEEGESFSGGPGQWKRAPRSSPRLSPPFPSTTCSLPIQPSLPLNPQLPISVLAITVIGIVNHLYRNGTVVSHPC